MKSFFAKILIFSATLFFPIFAHAADLAPAMINFGGSPGDICTKEERICYVNIGALNAPFYFRIDICDDAANFTTINKYVQDNLDQASFNPSGVTHENLNKFTSAKSDNYTLSIFKKTDTGNNLTVFTSGCGDSNFTKDACTQVGGVAGDVNSQTCGAGEWCLTSFSKNTNWGICKFAGKTTSSGAGGSGAGSSGSGGSGGSASSGGGNTDSNSGDNNSSSGGSINNSVNLINPLAKTVSSNAPIQSLAARLINVMFGISGSVALFMFVLGGFLWLASAGNENMVSRGKEIFQWASLGLVVMFSSYVIVQYLFGTLLSDYGTGGDAAAVSDTPGVSASPSSGGGGGTGGPAKQSYCCLFHDTKFPKEITASSDKEANDTCVNKYSAWGVYNAQCTNGYFCVSQSCKYVEKGTCAKGDGYLTYTACGKATPVK